MPVVERELNGFELSSSSLKAGSNIEEFSLTSSANATFKGFTYTLTFPLYNAYRVHLTGPDRPSPPHDNVILPPTQLPFKLVSLDTAKSSAVFAFPELKNGETSLAGDEGRAREIRLNWRDSIQLSVWETTSGSSEPIRLLGDLPNRSYALTEHGITRHWWMERNNLHLGMGEKAAPIDLTGRSFQLHGSDAACYDAYEGDPLYKHTPFIISTPRPEAGKESASAYAIYHPTNANCEWDLGRWHDDPWGYFKRFTQDFGGLEEWVFVGKGVKEIVRTFAEVVGRPKLLGRDWLGYLGELCSGSLSIH
jgi:hypothetical protein